MRLKIRLGVKPGALLPFDYQWPLAALIYKMLSTSDPRFAKVLHDAGFPSLKGPEFKFFTFSRLWAGKGKTRVQGDSLQIFSESLLWKFDTPILQIGTLFAESLLSKQHLNIAGLDVCVEEVVTEKEPDFSSGSARFTCLCPLVASVPDEQLGHRYLEPKDPGFWEVIAENLRKKWQTLYGTSHKRKILFFPDTSYIERNKTGKMTILKNQHVVKGHLVPFGVQAPGELIALGFHAGFGSRNSMGFGMVEVAREN